MNPKEQRFLRLRTLTDLLISRCVKSTQRCLTKATILVRFPACIESCARLEKPKNALKYGSTHPGYFANIEQARAFCRLFFSWYNNQHRHSGIGLHTPADIHHGRLTERRSARQDVLDRAFKVHPERFVKGNPSPPTISATVYINRPVLANAA